MNHKLLALLRDLLDALNRLEANITAVKYRIHRIMDELEKHDTKNDSQ